VNVGSFDVLPYEERGKGEKTLDLCRRQAGRRELFPRTIRITARGKQDAAPAIGEKKGRKSSLRVTRSSLATENGRYHLRGEKKKQVRYHRKGGRRGGSIPTSSLESKKNRTTVSVRLATEGREPSPRTTWGREERESAAERRRRLHDESKKAADPSCGWLQRKGLSVGGGHQAFCLLCLGGRALLLGGKGPFIPFNKRVASIVRSLLP